MKRKAWDFLQFSFGKHGWKFNLLKFKGFEKIGKKKIPAVELPLQK
jgi:hypothetical protein